MEFDRGARALKVLQVFCSTPAGRTRSQVFASKVFLLKCLCGRRVELCNKSEGGESVRVVNSNGKVEPKECPRPFLKTLAVFLKWFCPNVIVCFRSNHESKVLPVWCPSVGCRGCVLCIVVPVVDVFSVVCQSGMAIVFLS